MITRFYDKNFLRNKHVLSVVDDSTVKIKKTVKFPLFYSSMDVNGQCDNNSNIINFDNFKSKKVGSEKITASQMAQYLQDSTSETNSFEHAMNQCEKNTEASDDVLYLKQGKGNIPRRRKGSIHFTLEELDTAYVEAIKKNQKLDELIKIWSDSYFNNDNPVQIRRRSNSMHNL